MPDTPTPRRGGRWLTLLLVLTVVAGVAGTGTAARTAWLAVRGPGEGTAAEQIGYLTAATADGAATDMQRLFPEGFVFTHVLTGLAAAAEAGRGVPQDVAVAAARDALAAVDGPAGRAPFPPELDPPYGVFHAGWSLLLAAELARLEPTPGHDREVRERAATITAALDRSPSGFLESYPGQVWPVDTVVAVAALAQADRAVGVDGAADVIARWRARADALRSRAGGLLPHRLDGSGGIAEGPRGSSQALILTFLPDADPARAAQDYRLFTDRFVTRRFGLVGVREYPEGSDGTGDVDSGPLVAGVSLSASAVALGAARRQGDEPLARALDTQAEWLGLPVTIGGARRYAAGLLPVGDAFLAFARTRPVAPSPAGPSGAPRPVWAGWILVPLVPALLGAGLLTVLRRGRNG